MATAKKTAKKGAKKGAKKTAKGAVDVVARRMASDSMKVARTADRNARTAGGVAVVAAAGVHQLATTGRVSPATLALTARVLTGRGTKMPAIDTAKVRELEARSASAPRKKGERGHGKPAPTRKRGTEAPRLSHNEDGTRRCRDAHGHYTDARSCALAHRHS